MENRKGFNMSGNYIGDRMKARLLNLGQEAEIFNLKNNFSRQGLRKIELAKRFWRRTADIDRSIVMPIKERLTNFNNPDLKH